MSAVALNLKASFGMPALLFHFRYTDFLSKGRPVIALSVTM